MSSRWVVRLVWPFYRFAMRRRHGSMWPLATDPIPLQDVERAAHLAKEEGWAGVPVAEEET
jgi:hypothetical protein